MKLSMDSGLRPSTESAMRMGIKARHATAAHTRTRLLVTALAITAIGIGGAALGGSAMAVSNGSDSTVSNVSGSSQLSIFSSKSSRNVDKSKASKITPPRSLDLKIKF